LHAPERAVDLKPEDVESTKAAHALGLGEMNLDRVKIIKA
jgi:hypothetical protein